MQEAMEAGTKDWEGMLARDIPSKGVHLPDVFYGALEGLEAGGAEHAEMAKAEIPRTKLRILEVGCGNGELAVLLHARGHIVLGVDVNSEAVVAAAESCPQARFIVADSACEAFPAQVERSLGLCDDLAAPAAPDPAAPQERGLFDFAVLQLLLSILVGADAREAVLANVLSLLRPDGRLYLSCSGESGAVNPKYAELYAQDFAATGERNTYYSRDAAGRVLYTTHHFEVEELEDLLRASGFAEVRIEQVQETSSRRPGEAANFLYVTASKPAEREKLGEAPARRARLDL